MAAAMVLACLSLCTVPLSARPTRSLSRPAADRLIAARPSRRAARGRTARKAATARLGAPGLRSHTAADATTRLPRIRRGAVNPSRDSGPTEQRAAALSAHDRNARRLATHNPSHAATAAGRQRSLAAQAAIDAANRDIRPARRIPTARAEARVASSAPPAARSAQIQQNAPDASSLPDDGNATGDASVADNSATLTGVGGTLDPATEAHPLPSIAQEAATSVLLPALRVSALYDSRGRLILPPPLYGSRQILLHQNQMADRDGLARVRDDADLLDLRRQQQLVPLPEGETLRVDDRLPQDRRYARPWTSAFLAVLARDFYANFHQPLQVNSAVRTVDFQQRLARSNANAAPSFGDTASPHLTGQAVDIAKHGLSIAQIAWLRTYLQPLIGQGKIDVEEEFQQACFHISVYKSYASGPPSRVAVVAAR